MKAQLIALLIAVSIKNYAQEVKVSNGSIHSYPNFQSHFVDARRVDIWLPENYSNQKKYDVLYMQDGQMLFDSSNTWNHQEWQVDETVGKLLKEGKINDPIVVGIYNNGAYRRTEYFPENALTYLPSPTKDTLISKYLMYKPLANNYLHFLIEELKPFVDNNFSSNPSTLHTFIAGSSMGALISMYAICEYPKVFGGAACISTHWPGISKQNTEIPWAFFSYLKNKLPTPKTHKIYFDLGTETLDSLYKAHQTTADSLMLEKGFTSQTWVTKEFTGANHTEKAWSKRLEIPLLFLQKK